MAEVEGSGEEKVEERGGVVMRRWRSGEEKVWRSGEKGEEEG